MGAQGEAHRYPGPQVTDYGTLVEITAAAHLLLGTVGVHDLTFSSAQTPGSGGELPGSTSATISDGNSPAANGVLTGTSGGGPASGGSQGASGGTGGHSGGGGQLPFTGLAVGAVTAIGSGFVAAGGALRRAVRARRP